MRTVIKHHGHHATTDIIAPNGQTIPVDNEMALLISLLWSHGIRTSECCQDDIERTPGKAVIDFPTMPAAMRFIKRCIQYADDVPVLDVGTDTYLIQLNYPYSGVRVQFPTWAIRVTTEAWMD